MGLENVDSLQGYCKELLKFHVWRQAKISALLSELDTVLLSRDLPGSFGSLNIILNHIVWAEMVWLGRVDNSSLATMQDVDLNGMLAVWQRTTQKWVSILDSAQAADFQRKITYYNTKGDRFENTLAEVIVHMVDHATYHVGQMMNAVRSFGVDPVPTNFIHYLRD